jgi:hypothetical protein
VLKILSASERPSASGQADRPNGHNVDNFHREDGFGLVTTVVHPPVKGACRLPTPPIPPQSGRFNTLGSSSGGRSQNVPPPPPPQEVCLRAAAAPTWRASCRCFRLATY